MNNNSKMMAIFKIVFAIPVCLLFSWLFEKYPDYLPFCNVVILVSIISLAFAIILGKKGYGLDIILLFAIGIFANKLYSYSHLKETIISIKNFNSDIGLVVLTVFLLLVLVSISILQKRNNSSQNGNSVPKFSLWNGVKYVLAASIVLLVIALVVKNIKLTLGSFKSVGILAGILLLIAFTIFLIIYGKIYL
jgi:hypothetical protein